MNPPEGPAILPFKTLKERISDIARNAHRNPEDIQVLAVSKHQSIPDIQAAINGGQFDFGESYVQEVQAKLTQLTDPRLVWHFIGPLQSNKTRWIAEHMHWVHSLDRIKIAERLNAQRPAHLPALNVCIQVNLDQEIQKSGIELQDIPDFLKQIQGLTRLRCRGLMALPKPRENHEDQRAIFEKLHQSFIALQAQGFDLDTLSMGTSQDFQAAIEAGATWIRLGQAFFKQSE